MKSISDTLQISEGQITSRALSRVLSSTIQMSEGLAKEVLGNAKVIAGRKRIIRAFDRSKIARIFKRSKVGRGAGN